VPTVAPTLRPTPTTTARPTPLPTPRPSATPAGGSVTGSPSASRLAVLTKCPGQSDCYVYTIRAGDNLWSIAHWFGVPVDRVVAMNPWLGPQQTVRAGQMLIIPTPTR
jgi:LysM repeat protein